MRRVAIALACAVGGCSSLPFGDTLIVIDTDVPVPVFAGRVRVDLYGGDGSWYQSREFATPSGADWPLSFGVYSDGGDRTAHVRVRAFPDGATRDYRGEVRTVAAPFVEPPVAPDVDALCNHAPTLPPLTEVTLRRGDQRITGLTVKPECPFLNQGGSVAARVDVPSAGSYRFEVVKSFPDGSHGDVAGDTILMLRTGCTAPETQVACNDDIDTAGGNLLSRIVVALQPGSYFLVTGGNFPSPADLTLRWGPVDQWSQVSPPPPPPPGSPDLPRLQADGVDLTPADEPQPNVAIDRLIDVAVRFGVHRETRVLLSGECLGAQADLSGAQSCVDTAGVLAPVRPAVLSGGVDRTISSVGSWAAAQPSGCTVAPRAGGPLLDEEVCVPGGAFLLGTPRNIGVEAPTAPSQAVVLPPFLMDKYEVTVGRYRRALRDGFVSPDPAPFVSPIVNDAPLAFRSDGNGACTFNGDASGPASGIDREKRPLNCITWNAARALCRFLGGELPSVAQWEYAARAAGRALPSLYPWGDAAPDCQRTYWGAGATNGCQRATYGPVDVDLAPWSVNDVTPAGLVGMGGNVAELNLDSFRPYADPCWWQAPLRGVGCSEVLAPERPERGGSWDATEHVLRATWLDGLPPSETFIDAGVRCVRPGTR